ncbi:uncharacterized protein METZ01_LOCUS216169 [marine metagenome]|uniref:Uncharacterized protein n=1 Tax=marine metagenome TaxID=408172 RepID=A0A382FL20_9ZZZZ
MGEREVGAAKKTHSDAAPATVIELTCDPHLAAARWSHCESEPTLIRGKASRIWWNEPPPPRKPGDRPGVHVNGAVGA